METTLIDGIIIGAVGGFLAGLSVYFAGYLMDYLQLRSDKVKVYKALNALLPKYMMKCISVVLIANEANLTVDRTMEACGKHPKIHQYQRPIDGIIHWELDESE